MIGSDPARRSDLITRAGRPRTASKGVQGLFVVPPVLHPFPYIATHVVESKLVRFKAHDGRGDDKSVGVVRNVGIAGEFLMPGGVIVIPYPVSRVGREVLAPWKIARLQFFAHFRGRTAIPIFQGSDTRCIAPLLVSWKPIGLAFLLAEPLTELHRLIEMDA